MLWAYFWSSPSMSLFILNLFHKDIMERLSSPASFFFMLPSSIPSISAIRHSICSCLLTCASVRLSSLASTAWPVVFGFPFVSAVAGFLLTLASAAAGLFMPMVAAGYSVWGALVLNLVEKFAQENQYVGKGLPENVLLHITFLYFLLLLITFYYCLLLLLLFIVYYCLLLFITSYYFSLLFITSYYCLLLSAFLGCPAHSFRLSSPLFWAVQPTHLHCPAHSWAV